MVGRSNSHFTECAQVRGEDTTLPFVHRVCDVVVKSGPSVEAEPRKRSTSRLETGGAHHVEHRRAKLGEHHRHHVLGPFGAIERRRITPCSPSWPSMSPAASPNSLANASHRIKEISEQNLDQATGGFHRARPDMTTCAFTDGVVIVGAQVDLATPQFLSFPGYATGRRTLPPKSR
jgi:hypothetical protein